MRHAGAGASEQAPWALLTQWYQSAFADNNGISLVLHNLKAFVGYKSRDRIKVLLMVMSRRPGTVSLNF